MARLPAQVVLGGRRALSHSLSSSRHPIAIPAQAGIQSGYAQASAGESWAPAYAGVTVGY